jgi:chorismate mutase
MKSPTPPFGGVSGSERRPVVLAGPSRVESEQQIDEVARRLHGVRVDWLAAGVWSGPGVAPRGGHAASFDWLRRAADRRGLGAATEPFDRAQIEAAVGGGADLLWLGPASTADPRALRELVQGLRGVSLPVLVAGPGAPEIGPWMEALERVSSGGVRAIGALHVGCPGAGEPASRAALGWELVYDLRRLAPEIPVFAAVSRLAVERQRLAEVAQAALDAGLDGLQFEVHGDPDHAWEGAARHVTPERAAAVLANLELRREADPELAAELDELRGEIDRLDRDLLALLAARFGVVDRIGRAKRERGAASFQADRWRRMVEARTAWATALGLDAELARAVFAAIHGEAVRRQSEIFHRDADVAANRRSRAADDPEDG